MAGCPGPGSGSQKVTRHFLVLVQGVERSLVPLWSVRPSAQRNDTLKRVGAKPK